MKKLALIFLSCCVLFGAAAAARRNDSVLKSSQSRGADTTFSPRDSVQIFGRIGGQSVSTGARTAVTTPRTSSVRAAAPKISTVARGAVIGATLGSYPVARAALATNAVAMGSTYNVCKNNYFTCMDQFCGLRDDTYRRCMCSSRLFDVREMQRVLNRTQQQLLDFKDYNIESVDKTSKEVKAMLSATPGEYAAYKLKENSDSTNQLASISSILSGTRKNALSTAGTLDIAGDISLIWNTTDFISGADISTLEGDRLYNAVHNQCYDMVMESCGNQATLNMVVSAYGMLIEQDCNAIMTNLNQKKVDAQAAVRLTERELNVARLDNYDIHNTAEINECIAQVRKDVTNDAVCGVNYVHCLDTTGKFLNYTTGDPIYSPDFYRLEKQLSLDGDILRQPTNQLLASVLNNKRQHATRGLDTCRDIADMVWEEYLRQAMTEIYQGQQAKVRKVKDECIAVVTECYDTQRGQLKDFSVQDKQALLGQDIELTEELCKMKMETCSNLYGGGPNGMKQLLDFMKNVQTAIIADDCERYLEKSIHEYCSFALDAQHPYPYSCRVKPSGSFDCQKTPGSLNHCDKITSVLNDYADSLYNTISKVAKENCVRPSVADTNENGLRELPPDVQKSVNAVFDRLYGSMWGLLGGICRSMDGEWLNKLQDLDDNNITGTICVSNKVDTGCAHISAELLEFKTTVFSHASWGACERTYCNTRGDMYIWAGKKRCCEAGYIWNAKDSKCEMTDCGLIYAGSHLDNTCDEISPDENATPTGCIASSCRCDKGLVIYNEKCELFKCEMVDAVKDDRCQSASTGIGACLMSGCRCKAGTMPLSANSGEPTDGSDTPFINKCVVAP